MTKTWIFLILLVLKFVVPTVIDITGKKHFCLYKKFPVGELHLSAEFVAETEDTNNIQVSKKCVNLTITKEIKNERISYFIYI